MSRIVESLYQKYDLNESKQNKSRKRKLTEADSKDIIEYRAVLADMNFYTINKCKDILKSYNLEFMYVTFDKYGGYPYIEFRGSKQDIIKFLTSDFCGESEDDLRKRKPELFESKQRRSGKRKLNESSYSEPLFETIENALYNAGLDVTRFSDAMIMSNNLGWVVSNDDGDEVQIECLGTW